MKVTSVSCAFVLLLVLTGCGKDSDPAKADSSAQAASPAPAPSPTPTPASAPAPKPDASQPGKPPKIAPAPAGAGDCPLAELAGTYQVASITCTTDRVTSAVDAAAMPTQYVVTAQQNSGTVAMKIGTKTVTFTFPRTPDAWVESRRSGTFCTDLANAKTLLQSCPGTKDCYYSIEQNAGGLSAIYYRKSGAHEYECHAGLTAR